MIFSYPYFQCFGFFFFFLIIRTLFFITGFGSLVFDVRREDKPLTTSRKRRWGPFCMAKNKPFKIKLAQCLMVEYLTKLQQLCLYLSGCRDGFMVKIGILYQWPLVQLNSSTILYSVYFRFRSAVSGSRQAQAVIVTQSSPMLRLEAAWRKKKFQW